jgi:drug/metabolite transporter (DMT)-like permease
VKSRFPHLAAALQALLVTFLWSTSFVLIKMGLEDIPALTFAGLRYSLAFLCLLPFALRPASLAPLRCLSRRGWGRLIALGFLFYTITQGSAFLGLAHLPAVTVSLLLSFTPVIVALLGIPLLAEQPTAPQWIGVLVNVVGAVIYFYPVSLSATQIVGLTIVAVGVLANAGSSVLGRRINRERDLSPLMVTIVSMGSGAATLLVTGVLFHGCPQLEPAHWAIIGWLAVVNTAFAFTLWNHTLRTLTAAESSIINNTMLIQIAILAWLFLGERLTGREMVGMALAGVGALIVQLRRSQNQQTLS